jgi:hypothetical protein
VIQYNLNHSAFGHILKAETHSVYINTVSLMKSGGAHTVLRKILRDYITEKCRKLHKGTFTTYKLHRTFITGLKLQFYLRKWMKLCPWHALA